MHTLSAVPGRAAPVASRPRARWGSLVAALGLVALSLAPAPQPQAAEPVPILAQAMNPMDGLEARSIPKLERFDWQPKELVAVVGEHFGRHASVVHGVAYHPSGKHVISAGANGWVRIWDPATMRLQEVLSPTTSAIYAMALSRDGKRLAVGTAAGTVSVWDFDKQVRPTHRHTFTVATAPIYAVDLSPDNNQIAIGVHDTSLLTWNLSGKDPKEISSTRVHTGPVYGVAYSPDGKRLVSGSADKSVRLWDVTAKQPKEIANFMGHENVVRAVAFSPDDSMLASGGLDNKVRFWDPTGKNDKQLRDMSAHTNGVYALGFSRDSKQLATGGGDSAIHSYEVRGDAIPKQTGTMATHWGPVYSVAFGKPDNSELISGSADWTARLWFLSGVKEPFERTVNVGHLSYVYAVAVSPDGKRLATSAADSTIRIWKMTDVVPGREFHILKTNYNVTALAFSPDSKTLSASNAQGTAKLIEVDSGRDMVTVNAKLLDQKNQNIGLSTAVSMDGTKVLWGCRDKTIRVWDLPGNKELGQLKGHEGNVTSVSFSPDGTKALSGAGEPLLDKLGYQVTKDKKPVWVDPTVRLWDVANLKPLNVVGTHISPPGPVLFGADGKHGWSMCGNDASLKHWDAMGAKEMANTFVKTGYLYPSSVSSDGKRLITRNGGFIFTAWDQASGKKLQEWPLKEYATCSTFSADNRYLVVGLWTGVVYILKLDGPGKA